MSTIKSNVADYLTQIERLTNTNLQILKTINDSFFTKQNHLYADVNDTTYVIPSFISLENKINMLQENFENLIKAPETCEAYFNFDGNTRAIEVRKYNHTPDSITIPTVTTYGIDSNDIFKDFMTPVPYINIDLPSLPNDIVEVNIKKIVAKSDFLKAAFKARLGYTKEITDENGQTSIQQLYHESVNAAYSDINKFLLNSVEDVDYVEYDTIYKLPIRKNIGTGSYVIESVISDEIDESLNELITLKLRDKLTYRLFDETIEKPLQVGDELINYDGTGKVVITEVRTSTNTIVVKVVNGEYLNFLGTDSYDTNNGMDIHDMSKLRFNTACDFTADKYIKLPLEEDQYVFVAIAPVNSRMNVQAPWGTGLIIDTYSLKNNNINFNTYYKDNVKNIGDVLFEMTSMVTSPITKLSQDEFNTLTSIKPIFQPGAVAVMQINKHLNNSTTVKNIRNAYNQKKAAESSLSEVQVKINDINTKLSAISFDDVSGVRSSYTAQLNTLNNQKNELLTIISNSMDTISINANAAEIPIENAKYRIRGFYVPNINIGGVDYANNVIGIKVQYRYKNLSTELGNATSINSTNGNKTYIYSDWNNMSTSNKNKIAKCIDGTYKYEYEASNENINEPSYNQIDIPISQGETVDIRVKLVYDFGQPYVTVMSDWSDIVNVAFPDEFIKDTPILTIIEENNNDIETNRFNNILKTSGVDAHINDVITDQNITYYHKPESIASGFYTDERKIIPLKDKLMSLSNDIALIKNNILGATGNFKINAEIGDMSTTLYSDRENSLTLESYNSFSSNNGNGYQYEYGSIGSWDLTDNHISSDRTIDGAYAYEHGVVSTLINISIVNTGDTAMKLYSLFPGNRDVTINRTASSVVNKNNYCNDINEGVWYKYQPNGMALQTQNQFITFRINDPWTGQPYYKAAVNTRSPYNESRLIDKVVVGDKLGMVVYPFVSTKYGLCIDSDDVRSYIVINPGEEIVVPLYCEFVATEPNTSIEKTIAFDIRTSLYSDPTNYTLKIIGKNTTSIQDQLTIGNKRNIWNRLKNNSKYNITVK